MSGTSEGALFSSAGQAEPFPLEERKELFVLTADLVGYSELVFRDARGGLAGLMETRAILADAVARHRGKVVSTPGDFLLAVFSEAVGTVAAAVEAQSKIVERNRAPGVGQFVNWRVGIAFGDVFEIGNDVYGTAVNVAARIQALGNPGDILVEERVAEQLGRVLLYPMETLGVQKLKNISQPVAIHRLHWPGLIEVTAHGEPLISADLLNRFSKPTLKIEPFDIVERTDRKALIARAIEDELHIVLSRMSNSISILDRDSDSSRHQIDYVLKGNLQSAGRHLRLMVRLVSQHSGASIWAERYECDLRQGFDVQDEIAREVVVALQLALTEGEQARFWRRGTRSGIAWEQFQIGRDYENRYSPHSHQLARRHYDEALKLDPEYLSALVALGFCHLDEIRLGWSADSATSLAEAESALARATAIDADHPDTLSLLAFVRQMEGRQEEAKAAMQRAVAAAGQNSEIIGYQGALYDLIGDFPAAVRAYTRAISLTSHAKPWIGANLGLAHLAMRRVVDAERIYRSVIDHYPNYARAWIGLAVTLSRRGQEKEAAKAAARVLELEPGFKVSTWGQSRPFSNERMLEEFMADLRKVGLPA